MARSRVRNVNRLRRKLRRFPEDTTEEIRRVIADGAQDIETQAMALTNSDRVRANISVRLSRRDRLTAEIGILGKRAMKRAFMAKWLEFGTKPHSLKKGSRSGGHGRSAKRLALQSGGMHPGARPKPYLLPAFRLHVGRIRAAARTAVDRAIAKVARGV